VKRPIFIISLLCLSLCATFVGAEESDSQKQQQLLKKSRSWKNRSVN